MFASMGTDQISKMFCHAGLSSIFLHDSEQVGMTINVALLMTVLVTQEDPLHIGDLNKNLIKYSDMP
jgi:hypothetical protein